MLKYFIIFLILSSIAFVTKAQTFGFGCLGFMGGYGGFSYQEYNPAGLNNYIESWNSLEFVHSPLDEFSSASGYRVGLNFFRATFQNGIIVTAKGYYQYLSKENKAGVGVSSSDDNYSMDLTFNNWSLGFDVGWQFTKVISWKILDGSLNFNNVTLTETTNLPGETYVYKYKSDSGVIGYSIGSGIIVSIIKDYISIEGLAGYTYLSIDDLKYDDGTGFLAGNPEAMNISLEHYKFIDSGGFTAVIQLNVGFPLL
jgi:hypothetical protein